MTKKIGISLPDDLYLWMQSQIEQGLADSVSGMIADAMAAVRQRVELANLVADLTAEFGEPDAQAKSRIDAAVAALREARRGAGDTQSRVAP